MRAEASDLSPEETLTIGEVINDLRAEFPELSVSKLRFLESQGLIHPPRSESGYRMFGRADVERVRYILQAQRDHFLPLKVIKSKLTAWERGEEPRPRSEEGLQPEAYFSRSGGSMTRRELGRAASLGDAQISDLVAQGVLVPTERDDGTEGFRDEDVTVARAAARLLSHGLEVRHLRVIRLATDRETDLLSQLVAPLIRHPNPDNRRNAAEILADCAQAVAQLQEALVRIRLGRLLET